ncbi:MAG: discoidin domain-containing protein, partial [Acidimicrobiia bacterium]|nr:discoidin domain-containing protein [Acidimicrobiia bacterium]
MTDQPTGDPSTGQEPDSQQPGSDASRIWLYVAAVAVIVVPTIIGFVLLRNDAAPTSVTQGSGGGMASDGMGGSSGAVTDEIPEGVLAFADIQDGDIVIEADSSGAGAVLRVNTTIDVACAVAFGPTNQLGSLATDSDMAGGGHAVHQPLMRGLVSGATYFYRLQGIGPQGELYQSEVMQFTYVAAEGTGTAAVDPPAPNVASLGRVTGASSEYSDAFAARNAIDEDLATEWSSAGDGDDAFIVLEFDDLMIVQGVGFRSREMTDGTAITLSFTVTVDGGTTYGPFEAGPGLA